MVTKNTALKIISLLGIGLTLGCGNAPKNNKEKDTVYPTVSYLDIKLGEGGKLPSNPYILSFKNGNKEVVFCGVNHLTDNGDIENPLFKGIESRFKAFKPNICINEGGDISQNKYLSTKDAILKDGEIGLLKVLADSAKIKTLNGDIPDSLEFKRLLKQYTKGELLAYIITERLMWQLKDQKINDTLQIKSRYEKFIHGYIMKRGNVQLTLDEQGFDFYRTNYAKLVGRPFSLETLVPTNPFDPKERFQAIGRRSKEIRDQYLLSTIDTLLDTHDKVFIVFGGWHLLTCKPGLEAIINKKR